VDAAGNVYVSDTGNDRIQKFTNDGVFLMKWGSYGSGPGQFDGPMGLDVNIDGSIFISEWFSSRVQRFIP
jgi:tripartite motif-containing protein 71